MMGFRQRKLALRGWLGMRDNLLVSASSPCTYLQNGCIEVGAAGRAESNQCWYVSCLDIENPAPAKTAAETGFNIEADDLT